MFTVEGKDRGTIDGKDIQDFWGAISLQGQPWKADPRAASSMSPGRHDRRLAGSRPK